MGFWVRCIRCGGCHGLGVSSPRGEGDELEQKTVLIAASLQNEGGSERCDDCAGVCADGNSGLVLTAPKHERTIAQAAQVLPRTKRCHLVSLGCKSAVAVAKPPSVPWNAEPFPGAAAPGSALCARPLSHSKTRFLVPVGWKRNERVQSPPASTGREMAIRFDGVGFTRLHLERSISNRN